MGVQLVKDIYDIPALKTQHEEFIGLLKESKAMIVELNNTRVTAKNSTMAEFSAAVQELNRTMNQSVESTNRATAAQNNLIKTATQGMVSKKQQIQLDKEAIKVKQEDEKLEQQQERTKQQKIKTQREEIRQQAIEEGYIKRVTAEKTKLEAATTKEIKNQEKLVSEYQQLNARYIIAANTAKNLAAAELLVVAAQGKESAAAKQAAIDTKMASDAAFNYHTQLLRIDQAVGQSQRNVGNYTSATFALTQVIREAPAFANSFATGISAISNNLPILIDQFKILKTQVGSNMAAFKILAGSLLSFQALLPIGFLIVQSYGKEIAHFFKELFTGNKIVDEAVVKQKALKEVTRSLGEEYIKSTTAQLIHMERLREVLTDGNHLETERKLALEEYNKVADHANQIDIKQLNNITLINDSISRQITLIERRALATASEKILSERAEKFLLAEEKAREKAMKDQDNEEQSSIMMMYDWNNKMLRKMGKEELTYEEYKARQKEGIFANYERKAAIDRKIAKDKEVQQTKAEFDAAKELYRKNMDSGEFVGKKDTYKKPPKEKKDTTDNLQELKEKLDNEFEVYQVHEKAKIRLLEAEIASDKTYYLDKLLALEEYTKVENELLNKQEQNAKTVAIEKAAREKQHLQEEKAGKSKEEQKRIDENIKITEQNLKQELLLIEEVYGDKRIELVQSVGKRRQDIIDAQHDTELKNYKDFKALMESEEKKDDDRIKEAFRKREQHEREYREKELQMYKELQAQKMEVANQAEGFLYNLATAAFENQLNNIKEQKDLIDKQKEADLAANEAVVQSAQDKAANIAIINSRAQIQKEALERKAADIQYRKAQFERAQQVFEIGVQTIKALAAIKLKIAEIRAAAVLNPLLLNLIPIAAAQIPLALASSALSIGALFAKPLPKYKGGRGEGIEELAVTGDGGVSEYVVREDGTIEKTPAVETITHLMPKDRVLPNKAALMKELAISAMPLFNGATGGSSVDKQDMERFAGRIENAVGSIQIHTQLITREGWAEHNKNLRDYDNWVDTVIKGKR